MKKLITLGVLAACSLFGQGGTVAISKGNATDGAYTQWFFYSGTNLQYICKTPAFRNAGAAFVWATTPTTGQATLTSIVIVSNTATATVTADHGFDTTRSVGALVKVSGSTTSALNANYVIQSVGSSTTWTFTTSGVADGTYNTAALTISTTAPRANGVSSGNNGYWSIERFTYDGSNNLTADEMATKVASGSTATNAYSFKCADRATSTGSSAIAYQ